MLVYGTSHAVVDGICAAVIFSILKNHIVSAPTFITLVVIYNLLAFGLQAVIGLITDHFRSPRAAVFLGYLLTACSALTFFSYPILAVVLAGFGNALFHVGAGSISLNLTPQKATAPGIYVAPGALGLLIGTLIGKNGHFVVWPSIVLLIILCLGMAIIKKPIMNYARITQKSNPLVYVKVIFLLIFSSIAIRSLVGLVLVFPWKTNMSLLLLMTVAVVLGKGLGGIAADKFGWVRVGVGSLLLSIPFLAFGANTPLLAIVGIFLFNVTMPITLVAVSNILLGRPGFAFGLTCLALVLGTVPVLLGLQPLFNNSFVLCAIIFISVACLYSGLQLLLCNQYFRYHQHGNVVHT